MSRVPESTRSGQGWQEYDHATTAEAPWYAAVTALLATACGGSRAPDATSSVDELVSAEPAIEPGGVAVGSVDLGDVTLEYVTVAPEGFEVGDSAPLLLAFPPGGQDLGLTQRLVTQTYAVEALERGWVVVSPAAPDATLFFQGSEALVPGFPRSDEDQKALGSLTGVPVRMFVGGNDPAWIEPAERAVEAFRGLGGDIELTVFPGEGHVLESTADGELIFDQLDSFRP